MSDCAIRLRHMRFWGRHGVTSQERESPQEIELDLEVIADCRRAAASDRIEDTLDYVRLYGICERVATQRSFALLEALASACLDGVFEDARVLRATIRARKPQLLEGATPEVELMRSRA